MYHKRQVRSQEIRLIEKAIGSAGAIHRALAMDYYRLGRQTGGMAERILNGTDPATMPVETLEKLRLHVNVKAAANMGVELPVDLILAADAVIDSFPP